MAQRDIHSFVTPLCTKLAEKMGFQFVDVELVKEGPGRYLRIYIDKDGGMSLSDCEAFHRAVQPMLDRVEYDFMEVSSPGIDRPLKTDADFARAMDAEVEAKLYRPLDGSKSIVGILCGVDDKMLTIRTEGGDLSVPRRDIAIIRPFIRFDEDEGEDEQ